MRMDELGRHPRIDSDIKRYQSPIRLAWIRYISIGTGVSPARKRWLLISSFPRGPDPNRSDTSCLSNAEMNATAGSDM